MRRWNSDTNAWDRIGGDLSGNSLWTDSNLDVRDAILVYFARRQRRRQWPLVLIRRSGLRDGYIVGFRYHRTEADGLTHHLA